RAMNGGEAMDLLSVLQAAVDQRCSDIHILVGQPPMMRKNGEVGPIDPDLPVLGREETQALIYSMLPDDYRARFEADWELDCSYEPKKCIVRQREVGQSTKSFLNALRASLREDPDIILVGEMRDYETIGLAVTAAETGHLCFATLHTQDAPSTVARIIDVFPARQQEQIRVQLANSLRAVLAQILLPRKD